MKTLKEIYKDEALLTSSLTDKQPIKYKVIRKKGYGYEKDKPILVESLFQIYRIIKNLKYNEDICGLIQTYNRAGLCFSKNFQGPVEDIEILIKCFDEDSHNYYFLIYDLFFCYYPPVYEEESIFDLEPIPNEIKIPNEFKLAHTYYV